MKNTLEVISNFPEHSLYSWVDLIIMRFNRGRIDVIHIEEKLNHMPKPQPQPAWSIYKLIANIIVTLTALTIIVFDKIAGAKI